MGGKIKMRSTLYVDFHLNFTGVISLSSLRKPDLDTGYRLNVSVTDGVFTAFTRVVINVHNSNNHIPTFAHAVYDMDVGENLSAGQRVGVLTATDGDLGEYGDINYNISSEDMMEYFLIDQDTGKHFI